jgi:mannose-6-phosphate isomerase-like protein (cupin superfamily)
MKISNKQFAPTYTRDGITSYLLVAASTSGARNITTSLVEMKPQGKQHVHKHKTEQSYFIISGKGKMTVGNEERIVVTGDSIFIPGNSPHGLINIGKIKLVYLSAGSPPFGMKKEKEFWPLAPEKRIALTRR